MTADAAHLSRRERQIMEIVYERGRATAAEVRAHMPDPPSYSAVRAMLRMAVRTDATLEFAGYTAHHGEAESAARQLARIPELSVAAADLALPEAVGHHSPVGLHRVKS